MRPWQTVRTVLLTMILVAAVTSTVPGAVPVIDVTDLYFPYQDQGDNFDLVAAYALPQIDLKAVILDPTSQSSIGQNFLGTRAPGQLAVEQLNLAFGRNVPYAYGPFTAMSSPTDTLSTAPANQQAGVTLLLNTLQQSSQPVSIMSFGSARVIAAAYNQNPTLMQQKVGMIYLSAGSQPQSMNGYVEWNVALDKNAYQCLLTSNLPIALMPCATATSPFEVGRYDTYYQLPNTNFITGMNPTLERYLAYQFNQEKRADFLPALREPATSLGFTASLHRVWETAAWMAVSGQKLVQHADGHYAIIPSAQVQSGDTVLPNDLLPVNIAYNTVTSQYSFTTTNGTATKWQYDRGSNPLANQTALQEALPNLYKSFTVNSQNLARLSAVAVNNPSFESQSVAGGQYTSVATGGSGALAGWTALNLGTGQDAGVLHPSSSMFGSVPDGSNVLYACASSTAGSTSNVVISQITSTSLQPNTKYILSALVGARQDVPFTGYDIQLLVNGIVLAEDNNSFPVNSGNFISTLVTYMAGTSPPAGNLEIRLIGLNGSGTGNQTAFAAVDLEAILPALVSATACTWSNSGTDWSSPANWGGTAPGSTDVALFNSNAAYTSQPTLAATAAIGGIWSTGSGALTIGGSALTLNSAVVNGNAATGIEMDPGAGNLTISAPLVLAGPQSWLNNSNSLLTVSGNIDNGGKLLTIAGSGNTTISGPLSGSGGLAKVGGGVATLSGSNSYTGGTAINSGALSIAGTNSLPGWSTAGSYTVANGAALAMGNGVTDANIAAILATGNFATGASLGFDTTAGDRSYAGVFANTSNGPLGLLKLGAGTLFLTNSANNFTGGVNLAAGTLNFSNNALNGLNNTVTFNGGTLLWATGNTQDISSKINIGSSTQTACLDTNGNNVTFAANISGAGQLVKQGAGTLELSGLANTYNGGTTVAGGVLKITGTYNNVARTLPGGSYTLAGGTLMLNYYLNWGVNNPITLTADSTIYIPANCQTNLQGGNPTISGAGKTLTKDGPGILFINTPNVTLGAIYVAAGILGADQGAGGGANWGGSGTTVTVANGGQLGPWSNITLPNPIVLNGGTGIAYSGGGQWAIFSGPVTLNSTTSIDASNGNITLSGSVSGSGGLTAAGGTLILSHSNTYTGVTTISNGTLQLANPAGSVLTATSAVENSSILQISAAGQNVGAITGTGSTAVDASAGLTATSIVQNTLTIGAGGSVTIRETAGASAVPEPGTWPLLIAGATSLLIQTWRKRKRIA